MLLIFNFFIIKNVFMKLLFKFPNIVIKIYRNMKNFV
jgi:hypothetical protein